MNGGLKNIEGKLLIHKKVGTPIINKYRQ